MKNQKTKTLRKKITLLCSLCLLTMLTYAQGHLQVTIQDGSSTTTCDDVFGSPDPHFRVNINNQGWTTYPATTNCFTDFPNMQYEAFFNCPTSVPTTIDLCFRVFENDGFFCNVDESCMEQLCTSYAVPAPGASIDYNVQIIDGLDSDGELDFTISLSDDFAGGLNDEVCDAVELGLLPFIGTLGDGTLSNYSNFCSDNINDPNPLAEGGVFGNDRGVWFTFETDTDVSAYSFINAFSDPEGMGDDIGLQIAIYESNDGSCNDITLIHSAYTASTGLDQTLVANCLNPDTRYYILIDAAFLPGTGVGMEGYFGLQMTSVGIIEPADFRCDAEDLGLVPTNGSVGTPTNQTNICGTDLGEANPSAFELQRSVWYMFQAPESGHAVIELVSDVNVPNGVDAIDLQAGLYGSGSNTCLGPMMEITSQYTSATNDETISAQCLVPGDNYWVVIDGSGNNTFGVFSITVSDGGPVAPQSITNLNEVICTGETLVVGDSTYSVSGTIDQLVLADNGCDSLILGTVTILDPIETLIDTVICNGESVTIGNSIYFESGNYDDVFTSVQSCDSTVYTNVIVLENVEAVAFQVQEASDQTANDGIATVTVTGGIGPYSYLWTNGATTETINNLSPGLYCVTVTASNGCEDVTCISVLYPGAISVDITNGSVTCNGDVDGTLTLTISDGTPAYDYEWGVNFGPPQGSGTIMNAGQSATINDLPPGDNYTITVTDGDGLIVVNFGEIIEPIPIVNNLDTTICFGETLVVGATSYTSSGPITENLITPDGCDSLVTGTLIVLDAISTSLDLTECFGTIVMVGNTPYSSTGPINEILTADNGCDSTVTGFLTILPEIATTLDTTVCFGESIQVGLSTYSATNTYSDTLPAFNGCDSIITTNLTVLNELVVDVILVAEASGLGDADGIAQANPTGGAGNYTYLWSDATTSSVATNLIGGQNYCVTVTDDIGCSAESCVLVLFPVDIQSTFVNDTLDCPGDLNGTLSFSAFNGQAPYSFTYQNEDNTLNGNGTINTENGIATVNGLPAGTYAVEISDVWGSGFFTIEIVEATPMLITEVDHIDASCFGECDGALEVDVQNGEAPYTYQWTGGLSSSERIENICPGAYEVTITDDNGCTMTWNGTINQPDEFIVDIIQMNPVSCNGGDDGVATITTNEIPTDILWSNGATTEEISNLIADTYSVTVTNSDNCTATSTLNISEPLSAISSVITIEEEISCNGENDGAVSIFASGGNGFIYSWDNGMTGEQLSDLGPGTYAVTIMDENGCEGFDVISLDEPSLINAEFTPVDVNCLDGDNSGVIQIDTVIGGAGDYVFSLTGDSYFALNEFTNLESGAYDVIVQDVNGCEEVFPVSVASPGEIMVDLGEDYTISLGETVVLEAITGSQNPIFKWSIDSLDCLSCSEIEFTPINAGSYSVVVTDTVSGCSDSDVINIMVSKDRALFVPNAFSPNGDGENDRFMVYPGPSVARINAFRVFNRWGATVFSAENILPGEQIGWDGKLSNDRAPGGVYVYYLDVEFIDGRTEMFKGDVTVFY